VRAKAASRIRVLGQDVIRGERQQRYFESVQITQAPGGGIAYQGSVHRDLVAFQVMHYLAEIGFAARLLAVADHVNDAAASLRPGGESFAGGQDGIVQSMNLLGNDAKP
jgi:hypothetical protein